MQIVANIKLLALYTNKLIIDHNTIDTIADPKLNVAYVKLPRKVQIITIKYNSNILKVINITNLNLKNLTNLN